MNSKYKNDLDAESRLSNSGLSKTVFRVDLLNLFYKSQKSLTIEEILKHFSDSINKVTIYRALEGFEEKGLVHKVPDRNNLIRYSLCKEGQCDINSHDHHHGHFICKRCDDTFCLEEIKFAEFPNLKGFYVEESNIVVHGYCQECYID